LVFPPSLILSRDQKKTIESKKNNENNFENLVYLDISDNNLLPPDLALISIFINLQELNIGPSGKKKLGKKREKENISLKPLTNLRNLRRLTVNGISMDNDLNYLRIFDYDIEELKNQRKKGEELILREWAEKTEKKMELAQEEHQEMKELILSQKGTKGDLPKVEEEKAEFFSTW